MSYTHTEIVLIVFGCTNSLLCGDLNSQCSHSLVTVSTGWWSVGTQSIGEEYKANMMGAAAEHDGFYLWRFYSFKGMKIHKKFSGWGDCLSLFGCMCWIKLNFLGRKGPSIAVKHHLSNITKDVVKDIRATSCFVFVYSSLLLLF